MEDLRGPAVNNTIRLDVQDGDEDTNGDTENSTAGGIIVGKSMEVRHYTSASARQEADLNRS